MRISEPNQVLRLPVGTLEVVTQQGQRRVCQVCTFTQDEVVDIASKLLEENVELTEFAAQAELVSYMTNRFGWRGYHEAFALDVFK